MSQFQIVSSDLFTPLVFVMFKISTLNRVAIASFVMSRLSKNYFKAFRWSIIPSLT